nr:response regulator [Deltaproteobacteria bacterium]
MAKPVRILCVDDEANVLKALQRLFMDDNYEILTATSSRQGIAILEQYDSIPIVISDYRMPEMSGIDFLREVCERWPNTIRIVLSGYADAATVVAAINEGQIFKFIPKPWNDDELRITIRNVIEGYFIRKRNKQLTKELQERNEDLRRVNDTLEALVEERTADLKFHNQVLARSQRILDELPVAVVGVDSNSTIVQCNRKAFEWLSQDGQGIMGMKLQETSLRTIQPLISHTEQQSSVSFQATILSVHFKVMIQCMMGTDDLEGIIIVLDKE